MHPPARDDTSGGVGEASTRVDLGGQRLDEEAMQHLMVDNALFVPA